MSSSWKAAIVNGKFERPPSQFRKWINSNDPTHPPAPNRYHLYISLACPWAHRTLITLHLKGLQHVIGLSIVDYHLDSSSGWKFSTREECPGSIPDTLYNSKYLRELYLKADSNYSGRITVPVLWDKQLETIVNNESADIIRMFNSSFNDYAKNPKLDLCPPMLLSQIEELNDWIYNDLNNGVYKTGFATIQEEYEKNAIMVSNALERLEKILSEKQFMLGDVFSEVDIRLFTTIIRFDPVYFGHFKCNLRAIRDCQSILRWLKQVYHFGDIKDTVNMTHIKRHYYMSHLKINPNQIVPLSDGPEL